MELNVLSGNADSGKVYSRAKFDPIKAEAEAKLAQGSEIQDGNKKGEHYYEEILYTNQFIHIPINGM